MQGKNDNEDLEMEIHPVIKAHMNSILYPYRSDCGIGYTSKRNYLKWWAIQLAIHSTVAVYIEEPKNHGEVHASICFPCQDTILQIIKIGLL